MLSTWWFAETIRLPIVSDAASKGCRSSSPTPGTFAAWSAASVKSPASRAAVRAVSRAGVASTAIVELMKTPISAPDHRPAQNEDVGRAPGRPAGSVGTRKCPFGDPTGAEWQDGPVRRLWLSLLLIVGLLVAGCTGNGSTPDPGPNADTPERAAAELATGLAKKDLKAVEFTGASGADVDALFQPLVAGMGPLQPEVSVGSVTRQDNGATADLTFTWAFAGIDEKWSYQTQARLTPDAGRWKTDWQPAILQPQLDGANRLSQRRLRPERGRLLGEGGKPIVVKRAVYRIGIDKAAIKPAQVKSSARRLARLVKIDPSGYAKRVEAAGKEAFVEAIVLRTSDKNLPLAADIRAIPGGTSIQDDLMLAPNRDFARPVIGVVGDATKEIVDASGGTVVGGDQVGLSGLQKRYDTQMRGTPGVRVQLVPTKNSGGSASPSPSPTPSPSTAPEPVTVFEVKPVAGKPLTTTLQVTLQKLAEKTLAKTKPAAALVAIRPSTGAVLVAANNSATKGQSLATVGRNPPGSTFKVVTSLALLRAGLTPDSKVTCPRTVDVNGKEFHNYSDYPSSHLGSIDLRTALGPVLQHRVHRTAGKAEGLRAGGCGGLARRRHRL